MNNFKILLIFVIYIWHVSFLFQFRVSSKYSVFGGGGHTPGLSSPLPMAMYDRKTGWCEDKMEAKISMFGSGTAVSVVQQF
jgi:hypothetical protein